MRTKGTLKGVEGQLIKDLTETAIPSTQLAKRYRVRKQAISAFIRRKGITRPTKPKRGKPEHTEKKCVTCQGLVRIAKNPRSDFICRKTLEKKLGCQTRELSSHLNLLKKKGLVSQKFGKLVSKKAEAAYQLYFKKRLPVEVIDKRDLGISVRSFKNIRRQVGMFLLLFLRTMKMNGESEGEPNHGQNEVKGPKRRTLKIFW